MTTREAALRQKLVAWILKERRAFQLTNFVAFEMGRDRGTRVDDADIKKVHELLHDLARRGLIMPDHTQNNPAFWELTELGETALEADDLLAVDSRSFVDAVRRDAPRVDAVAIDYLTEAARCIDAQIPKAASVMLGVCAEIASLQLADTLVTAAAPAERAKLMRESSASARLSRALEISRSLGYQKTLAAAAATDAERAVIRELEDQQGTLLSLIRLERNDAGHAVALSGADDDVVHAFTRGMRRTLAVISGLLELIEREIETRPRSASG